MKDFTHLKIDAPPVLDYLEKDDIRAFGALGSISMLKAFAKSVGRCFIKGHAFSDKLCPERVQEEFYIFYSKRFRLRAVSWI